jgi:hypothetical protein
MNNTTMRNLLERLSFGGVQLSRLSVIDKFGIDYFLK